VYHSNLLIEALLYNLLFIPMLSRSLKTMVPKRESWSFTIQKYSCLLTEFSAAMVAQSGSAQTIPAP